MSIDQRARKKRYYKNHQAVNEYQRKYYNAHKNEINERRRSKCVSPRKVPKVCYACSSNTSLRKNGKKDWRINYIDNGGVLFLCAKCDRGIIRRERENVLAKKYYHANPEHFKEMYHKSYYKNHEQILRRQRLRRQKPAYKEYLKANEQKIRLYKQEYHKANRERVLATHKVYVKAHREQVTAYQKRWRDKRKQKDPNYRIGQQAAWYRKRKAADPTYGTKAWHERRKRS